MSKAGHGTFTCPKCGGHYFGTSCKVEHDDAGEVVKVEIEKIHCHHGTVGGKPCGWSGDYWDESNWE